MARPRKPNINSDQLRAQLASRDFYPDRPAKVEVRETHVSWVFLAGERAYKLKKPVVLAFLDYGTARRRLQMCRAEVELNSRSAADIYVGVRSVAQRDDGALELSDADDPRAIDYLVEMRRYDDRATMAGKLARGELDRSDVRDTAAALARFHARASPFRSRREEAGRVALRVEENVRELLDALRSKRELARVLALERFLHAFLVAHADTFNARARRGHVRDVHGDLRAEHVLLGGEPRLLDCIEFDDELRRIDVAEDLAFLLMDLVAHGGGRYARALLEDYRDGGGEPGSDSLIAFYACNRALVRSKVELVRAGQSTPEASSQGRHAAAARELLGVAERYAWRARGPLAIVLCGLPAAGKSHLADALARAPGLEVLLSDVTRKRLAGIATSARAPAELYTPAWDRRTYRELGQAAAAALAAGDGCVVVDATFRRRADRDSFREAFAPSESLLFVECLAPTAVRAARAGRRERELAHCSDATAELVGGATFAWEPLDDVAGEAHVALRSDRAVEAQLEDLAALLDVRLRRSAGD